MSKTTTSLPQGPPAFTPRKCRPYRTAFGTVGVSGSLFLILGCFTQPSRPTRSLEAPPAVVHLLDLMSQRLLLMHEVARWKWNTGKPIADPAREQAFLEQVAQNGRKYDLEPGP